MGNGESDVCQTMPNKDDHDVCLPNQTELDTDEDDVKAKDIHLDEEIDASSQEIEEYDENWVYDDESGYWVMKEEANSDEHSPSEKEPFLLEEVNEESAEIELMDENKKVKEEENLNIIVNEENESEGEKTKFNMSESDNSLKNELDDTYHATSNNTTSTSELCEKASSENNKLS